MAHSMPHLTYDQLFKDVEFYMPCPKDCCDSAEVSNQAIGMLESSGMPPDNVCAWAIVSIGLVRLCAAIHQADIAIPEEKLLEPIREMLKRLKASGDAHLSPRM